MLRFCQVVSLYLVTLLGTAGPSVAAPRKSADRAAKGAREDRRDQKIKLLVEKAEAALLKGRPSEALQLYQQAYDTRPQPGLLYQIGRCHQGMGNAGRAAFSYRQYLKYATAAENRAEVEERAARMESLAAAVRGDGAAEEAESAREAAAEPVTEPK